MNDKSPKKRVTTSCANPESQVTNTASTLFCGSKTKTRPANSPTLFGVKTENVTPENTALRDFSIDICSISASKNFHFTDSKSQLTGIRTRLAIKKEMFCVGKRKLISL